MAAVRVLIGCTRLGIVADWLRRGWLSLSVIMSLLALHPMGRKHYCIDCHKEFLHPRNLLQHRQVKHQGMRFYCSDCSLSYTRQYNLTNHRLRVHPEKVADAELRSLKRKWLSNPIYVRDHFVRRPVHQTSTVVRTAARRKQLYVRRPPAPNGVIHRRPQSSVFVPRSNGSIVRSATAHVRSKPLLRTLIVARPSAEAPVATGLQQPFLCPLCPFKSNTQGQMNAHKDRHKTSAKYKCPLCSYSAEAQTTLDQHSAVHFGWNKDVSKPGVAGFPVSDADTRCMYCGLGMNDQGMLAKHQRMHITS